MSQNGCSSIYSSFYSSYFPSGLSLYFDIFDEWDEWIDSEYKELIRVSHPKRRYRQKLFRRRNVWNGSGAIVKVIMMEGSKVEPEEIDDHSVVDTFNSDGTNLQWRVFYSLKKKKRYLLPNILCRDIPSFEDNNLPLPLETVSVNKIYRHRAVVYDPFTCYHGFSYQGDLRRSKGKTKTLLIQKADGTAVAHRGCYSSIGHFLDSKPKTVERKLHFQYQILQFEVIPGLHNSRKYECSCLGCHLPTRSLAEPELYRLGKDIPRSGYLYSSTNELIDKWDTCEFNCHCRDYDCDHYNTDKKEPQKTFSLGEFPIRKEKKRVKNDWVFV